MILTTEPDRSVEVQGATAACAAVTSLINGTAIAAAVTTATPTSMTLR
ncbi:MAG: hypothetical protein KGJ36_01860 [Acidobacteriota bacterium]|nr:hypothetical protein [Acidobacteriota bacterium]